jgi:hypothetical protein
VTKPFAVRGAGRLALSMMLSALGAGCSKNRKTQTDSGNVVAAVARQRPATLPGALTKPIDQLTGEELFAVTRQLRFTGGVDRVRRCRGRVACQGRDAAQTTHVRVDAVDLQDSISARALPPNGVIALRANNRGMIADSMYNMRPTTRFEYYLIVLPGANGGRASWRLEELDATRGARAHRTVARGTMTECNHPFVRGARADFKTCATAAARPVSFSAFQEDGPEEPIWFGCSTGCCTADLDGQT